MELSSQAPISRIEFSTQKQVDKGIYFVMINKEVVFVHNGWVYDYHVQC
jgi:hypothetical protein